LDFLKKYGFVLLVFILIATRLFHFPSEIDGPHTWRQAETAQYIYSYVNEGINILKPSVCWMGGHKTLLLEFPLPEALIAVLYNIFGNHLWIARLFFLLSFSISAYYFYKSLKLIFNDFVPEIATLIYCSLPLSLFYSRAIHIDFFAIAFAHGMLYYYLKAILHQKKIYWLYGTLMALIAFVTKVPYAFYLAIPIVYIAIQEKKVKYLLKNSWWTLIPVIALFAWNHYSKTTNELAPDWGFIPNYNKFTKMWYWYFGTLFQRTLPELWLNIGSRILNEVSGIIGLAISLIGLLFYKKNKSYYFGLSWLIGTIIYMLIFFNLNVVHNYYQIPFIASISVFIAFGISVISKIKWISTKLTTIVATLLFLFIVGESYLYAEQNYYEIKYDQIDIGLAIKNNSKPEDLVIVTYGGLSPQCPNILYRAKRYGWSIPAQDANAKLYYTLYKEAYATKLVIIQPNELGGELLHFFNALENKKVVELKKHNLKIYLADLVFER
jgi:4-amino-4-deoxy-L-arabinose transferase-like glycosyltransferase